MIGTAFIEGSILMLPLNHEVLLIRQLSGVDLLDHVESGDGPLSGWAVVEGAVVGLCPQVCDV